MCQGIKTGSEVFFAGVKAPLRPLPLRVCRGEVVVKRFGRQVRKQSCSDPSVKAVAV